ncbi:cytochrome P450 [Sphingomonas azotifigens]|uniref:cytochrome P450 n=1 Tax=Sphingomonas azotifigens TaxID=330920 RepID=UPI001FE3022D|nr:cytochrome P450 [Sphingomonas azotifigens]
MTRTPVMDRITVPRPENVPADRVVDIDYYNLVHGDEDVHLAWKRLQDGPDIVWTPHNGGHWIFTRFEDIKAAQTDHAHFSMRSIGAPYSPTNFKPLNLDPPEHAPYRRLIMPHFLPKQVDRLEGVARQTAIELIEGFADAGHCEFITDFAKILPVTVFLGLIDLPMSDRDQIQPYADQATRGTQEERANAHRQMAAYLSARLDERIAAPGDDLFGQIIKAEVDGAPITRADLMSICLLLLFGGLDTVASMLGFIARFLAMNPDHRRQLAERIDDVPFIRHAVEELIRRHGVANTSRVVTMDYAYKDVLLREGDIVQAPNLFAGLDDRVVPNPLTVDFSRKFPIPHAAFGNGPHTCPGAVLARREIEVFLREWLRRIPDFELAGPARMASGAVNGVEALPLRWPSQGG